MNAESFMFIQKGGEEHGRGAVIFNLASAVIVVFGAFLDAAKADIGIRADVDDIVAHQNANTGAATRFIEAVGSIAPEPRVAWHLKLMVASMFSCGTDLVLEEDDRDYVKVAPAAPNAVAALRSAVAALDAALLLQGKESRRAVRAVAEQLHAAVRVVDGAGGTPPVSYDQAVSVEPGQAAAMREAQRAERRAARAAAAPAHAAFAGNRGQTPEAALTSVVDVIVDGDEPQQPQAPAVSPSSARAASAAAASAVAAAAAAAPSAAEIARLREPKRKFLPGVLRFLRGARKKKVTKARRPPSETKSP
ncbi:hypothetical protein M885DRAFT_558667 [Pelagophyceae sp. CCMP2097]|nr:hypothetical protein M885DRAFT_558667 [Pelagophyceae sp. CCMP2097]